jgi:hypothetical protein
VELIGVWDIAASGCTGQGNPDSDPLLVITRVGINNCEQTFRPSNPPPVFVISVRHAWISSHGWAVVTAKIWCSGA